MAAIKRAGVIGAGVFGGHHARHWSSLPGATLAGVFDPHLERAQEIAARHGARAFADCAEMLATVDVVSITSPAVSHGARALESLRAGKPIYVEKPLAASLEDADLIAREAAKRDLVVATGFSERAAFEALGLFAAPERPSLIEAVRASPPGTRNLDVSVVLDLMIHDIDLAVRLGGEPVTVEGEGAFGDGGLLDAALAEITFAGGMVARLKTSRTEEAVNRTVRLTYDSGVVDFDLGTGTATNGTALPLNVAFGQTLEGRDRLRASLSAFLDAVNGVGAPLADAADGVRALDLALAVERAAEENPQ